MPSLLACVSDRLEGFVLCTTEESASKTLNDEKQDELSVLVSFRARTR